MSLTSLHINVDSFNLRVLNEVTLVLSNNTSLESIHISTSNFRVTEYYSELLHSIFNGQRNTLHTFSISVPAFDKTNTLFKYLSAAFGLKNLRLNVNSHRFGSSNENIFLHSVESLEIDGNRGSMIDDSILDALQLPNLTTLILRRVALTKRFSAFVLRHAQRLTCLEIHGTTVRWNLHKVVLSCRRLKSLTMNFKYAMPLSFTNDNLRCITFDEFALTKINMEDASRKLRNSIQCLLSLEYNPFPNLQTIHLRGFNKQDLELISSCKDTLLIWETIIQMARNRVVSIVDENYDNIDLHNVTNHLIVTPYRLCQ